MQLCRVRFYQGLPTNNTTVTSIDLSRNEFKGWTIEISKEFNAVKVTTPNKDVDYVPFANVAYFRPLFANGQTDNKAASSRIEKAAKGTARAT